MNRRSLLKYAAAAPLAPQVLFAGAESESKDATPNTSIMKIQRLGWAGIKIELDGVTLFVDTTFSTEYGDLPITSETQIRHAIITHHHNDHFDPETLKKILK